MNIIAENLYKNISIILVPDKREQEIYLLEKKDKKGDN